MTDYGYKTRDCGKLGKAFERDLKNAFNQKAIVAKQGKIDFRRDRKCFEVKTGAGEITLLLKSSIKYVIYIPVVNMAMPIEKQEGFIISREIFLNGLSDLGLIRDKISSAGINVKSIQTFWNNKENKPHGTKYYKLIDFLYENSIMTLDEYFDCKGKF